MSTTTEEAGALAVRETSGAAIVKAVPIPLELQQLGVKIAAEETTGMRVIVLPAEVRQVVNLLTPVSSMSQADPNWTPSISVVKLDKDSHTYPLPGGKLGLNKQALETLGKCAGVLYTRTARVPNAELHPDEKYAYRATVGFRRSDGTVDEITRERGYDEVIERNDIEGAVTKGNKYGAPGTPTWTAEVEKRWIAERRFGPAKTESKAINRALRAGLAMPASVDAAALNKPFLVVGFNFTPDYTDPAQRAALIQIAHLRTNQIYGGREVSDEMPELAAGDIPAASVPPGEPGEGDAGARSSAASDAGEQAGGGENPPVAAGSSPEPSPEPEPEPDPDEDPSIEFGEPEPQLEQQAPEEPTLRVPDAVVDQAAQTIIASHGVTIAQLLEMDGADQWISWALRGNLESGPELEALELVIRERRPDLWAARSEAA